MDPYLGAIIIGAKVKCLDTNMNRARISILRVDLALTWLGVDAMSIGTDHLFIWQRGQLIIDVAPVAADTSYVVI